MQTNALKVPTTRNKSLYESGSRQNMRGSSTDVRGSQRKLVGSSAHGSSMGLEKRILKGGQNIMRNQSQTRSTLLNKRDQVGARERVKREQTELKALTQLVNKVVKDLKITMPPSKDSFMKICKGINVHCTEMTAFEGLIYCRGKQVEEAPVEDFDFDKMIVFLNMKTKTAAPADNPRNHLTTKVSSSQNHGMSRLQQGRLPPLRQTNNALMNQTNRSMLRSRQSYDSQDQRVTQAYGSRKNRAATRGSNDSPDLSNSRDQLLNRTYAHDANQIIMESQSPSKAKKLLATDPSFQQEMKSCLDHMEKDASLRAKVFNQLGTMANHWNEQKGQEGIIAGQATRIHLAQKRKEREQAQKRNLDKLIEDTAEVSALQAINLDQLLRKKWTDEKDAYVIMTNIKTDKQLRRLNDLCFNRYI